MVVLCLYGSGLILVFWIFGGLSLPHGEVTTPELLPAPDGKVTVRFSALGEHMSFHLTPDDEFLIPGLHIRHLGRGIVEDEGTATLRNCFYSSQEPLAAFSVCKGIQGAFLKGWKRFIIQPLKGKTSDGTFGPHLVMKAQRLGRKTGAYKEEIFTRKKKQHDREAGDSPARGQVRRAGDNAARRQVRRPGDCPTEGQVRRAGDYPTEGQVRRAGDGTARVQVRRAGDDPVDGRVRRTGDGPAWGQDRRKGNSAAEEQDRRAGDGKTKGQVRRAGDSPAGAQDRRAGDGTVGGQKIWTGNNAAEGQVRKAGDDPAGGQVKRAGGNAARRQVRRPGDGPTEGQVRRAGHDPTEGQVRRAGDGPARVQVRRAGDGPVDRRVRRTGDGPSWGQDRRKGNSAAEEQDRRAGDGPTEGQVRRPGDSPAGAQDRRAGDGPVGGQKIWTGNNAAEGQLRKAGDDPAGRQVKRAGDGPTEGQVRRAGDDPTEGQVRRAGDDPTEGQVRRAGDDPTEGQIRRAGDDPTEGQVRRAGDDPTEGQVRRAGDDPTEGQVRRAGDGPARVRVRRPGDDPTEGQVRRARDGPARVWVRRTGDGPAWGQDRKKGNSAAEEQDRRARDGPTEGQVRRPGDSPAGAQDRRAGDGPVRGQEIWTGNNAAEGQVRKAGDSPARGQVRRAGDRSAGGQVRKAGDSSAGGQVRKAGDSPARGQVRRVGDSSAGGQVRKAGDDPAGGQVRRAGDSSAGGQVRRAGDSSAEGQVRKAGDDPAGGQVRRAGDSSAGGQVRKAGDSPARGQVRRAGDSSAEGQVRKAGDDPAGGQVRRAGDSSAGGQVRRAGDRSAGGQVRRAGDRSAGGQVRKAGDSSAGGQVRKAGDNPAGGQVRRAGDSSAGEQVRKAGDSSAEGQVRKAGDDPAGGQVRRAGDSSAGEQVRKAGDSSAEGQVRKAGDDPAGGQVRRAGDSSAGEQVRKAGDSSAEGQVRKAGDDPAGGQVRRAGDSSAGGQVRRARDGPAGEQDRWTGNNAAEGQVRREGVTPAGGWGKAGDSPAGKQDVVYADKPHKISEVSVHTWRSEHSLHDATDQHKRNRRFVSEERFLEILLVADVSMVRFYGEDLKLHLLTLMSVAARIYRHPSLKNSLSLVVVKVLIAEDEASGPELSDNGGLILRSFCKWQQSYNMASDRHPEHYDTAILLTRQDFCGHNSCDTLGVADIGTVCEPSKSCSVIEDDGLQAAYTLAHELAHVLSIPHDNSNNCVKVFGDLAQHHLMAPLLLQLNQSMPWSPCSAMHLTDFFDSGYGNCLLDAPGTSLVLPLQLPGRSALYDLDNQCRQVFGEEFNHCPNTRQDDVCSQLWCKLMEEAVCHTKNGSLPWADGTSCGQQRICWDGMCQAEDEVLMPQVPMDGNWGGWNPWGECSRSCGGGVRFSYRDCNDPQPHNGGKYCQGLRARYESCSTEECPPGEKSFRDLQCEIHNYRDRLGNLKEWIPKYSGVSPRDRCKLMCQERGGSEFKVFQSKVVDGTLCGPDSLSVCVQGQCFKAGCDHTLNSTKKLDKCGVCGGDGSSCRKITGSLSKFKLGYSDIVTIPAGATSIDVKQRSHRSVIYDGIYLAIKRADGSYLLNGDYAVSSIEHDVHLRGSILLYSGSNTTLERIQSFQPLPEVLTIQLLRVAGESNPPKIKYTFYIPKTISYGQKKAKDKLSHNFLRPFLTSQWVLGDWSQCSKTCGSGWKRRTVECQDVDGVPSDQCPEELKPEDIRVCGALPCPMWRVGSWSHCSQTCGEGIKTQRVHCVDYMGKETKEGMCDSQKRPSGAMVSCKMEDC
ncbi:A disintegrin and metalloproteinase with thrombospondin motifs 8 [Anomaloglossus baeobatrachus]|uniref:A disintegrin and metalloproteinase with thrombospondin motifs 8 n=1 Tax=Anomaloglossus baeobatrachus TaxID=238106 RepID=UPI003F507B2B